MMMKKALVLAGVCLSLHASGAFAEGDSPLYLGGSLGEARAQNPQQEKSFLTYTQPSIDNSDLAGKLYGGYRFHPNWAMEFGYAALGKNSLKEGTFADSFRTDGLFASLRGTFPVNETWSLTGELGVIESRIRYHCESACVGLPSLFDTTGHGTSALVGVGVEYNVNKKLAVRAEYELYRRLKGAIHSITDSLNFRADHDLTSIGVVYRFD